MLKKQHFHKRLLLHIKIVEGFIDVEENTECASLNPSLVCNYDSENAQDYKDNWRSKWGGMWVVSLWSNKKIKKLQKSIPGLLSSDHPDKQQQTHQE